MFETAFVDVQGSRTHYLHAGSGKPMVLLHGLVGSSANWSQNIGVLACRASVYAIDQLNMGQSQRIVGLDPTLEAAADRVAATMTALGLDRADIAGHSHGGAVALMFAARHPERVRSLILFAPANPYSQLADQLLHAYATPLGGMAASMRPTSRSRFSGLRLAACTAIRPASWILRCRDTLAAFAFRVRFRTFWPLSADGSTT